MEENSKLDAIFRDAALWQAEADRLRVILRGCGLDETLKWRKACYVFEDHNIAIIQRMNDFLALMFFKGALLKDPDGVLEVQGPNSTAGYRMRFTSIADVDRQADTLRALVRQAIEVERSGLKVERASAPDLPDELVDAFDADPDLRAAFDELTPGRQRGYILHFAGAKQSATRAARIAKYAPRILSGKGMMDR